MTERDKFEQWASMPPRGWSIDRVVTAWVDAYVDHKTDITWQAWQAAIDASTHKAIYEDEA